MTRRVVLLGLGLVVVAAACSIQPDPAPRDIPIGERALVDQVDPDAGAAAGTSRTYLLTSDEESGERQLRSVLRDVDPTPAAVLEELFKGPNQKELEAGLRTALPEGLVLLQAPRQVAGILAVDVSSDILEVPGPALPLAVAEIVFTASELPGVRAVRLSADGERRAWPDGRGELQNAVLSVYDFPGLAESTQPPYPAIPSEPAL